MSGIVLLNLLTKGEPFLLLGVLMGMVVIGILLRGIRKDIDNIKNSITWGDTCGKIHEALDDNISDLKKRIKRLENGKIRGVK